MLQNLALCVSYIFRFREIFFFVKYYEFDPTDLHETGNSCNSQESGPDDCHVCDVKLCCRSDKHWDQTTEYFYLYVAPILTNTLSVGLPDTGHLWTKGSGISNFTLHDPTMARVSDTTSFTVFFSENWIILQCKKIYTITPHACYMFRHFSAIFREVFDKEKLKKNTKLANYDIDVQL